ncbi:MAG: NfeD family protein [Planctomycetota bacterium]
MRTSDRIRSNGAHRPGGIALTRRAVMLLAALLSLAPGWIQPATDPATGPAAPASVPAARLAKNVVVITVEGGIDRWTEASVNRRLAQAEKAGADAVVIELDTPGGELGAVLGTSQSIKSSSIANTVAWVNDDAYSGGAILALACREIVAAPTASMGDAFPVTATMTGLRGLTPDERVKLLPPLLADVTESARRNGYDEYLVQAIVVDGVELWAVEDTETGRVLFINESEHRALFDAEPVRGKPALASVPGGRAGTEYSAPQTTPQTTPQTVPQTPPGEQAADAATPPPGPQGPTDTQEVFEITEERRFNPASDALADVSESISEGLETETTRPAITPALKGRFINPVYVTDGTAPIVMRSDELDRFGFSAASITNDEQLKEFFGADELARVNMGWEYKLARFMSSLPVRILLIAVFLLGMLIEMTNPGVIFAGVAAAAALGALIVPSLLTDFAGALELILIAAGIILVAVELLLIPGFGVFGLAGIGAMFVGIMLTFVPDGPSFGSAGAGSLLTGATTTLLGLVTAGIGAFFLLRNAESLPLLKRLILQTPEPTTVGVLEAAARADSDDVEPGAIGETISPLRPSGRVRVDGRAYDAIATRGYIEAGQPVEVLGSQGFSLRVRPAEPRREGDTA